MRHGTTPPRCGFGRILALALVASTPDAAPAKADVPALAQRLAETIPEQMAEYGVAGAVVVILEDGAPVWTGAFGEANPGTGRPMTANELFRVESISKPVTAWGAMHLAVAGRLDLDAPVTDCLVRWQPPKGTPPFSARQLLSHTAGIGLGNFTARFPPEAQRPDLPDHFAQDFLMIGSPGIGFAYSDTGYLLLELVMEDCADVDFNAFMVNDILGPLGMERASFDWSGNKTPVGHDLHGRPVDPYVYAGHASGELHATAADIARFTAAGMVVAEQVILSRDAVAALHRPVVAVGGLFGFVAEGYGLGHFTETLSDGRAAVWHGGQGYGWMSHMHLIPATGDGIVILSNSQRAWPLFAATLKDWSVSLGVAPVGMARMLWAETAARAAITLGLAVAALGLWSAFRGWRRRRLARVLTGGIALALIMWPIWAAAQDYIFLFSILPSIWPWLGVTSALAGLGLTAVALGPDGRR